MKYKKTIQKSELVEIELETPCWFRIKDGACLDYYQVNSEDEIIQIQLHSKMTTIESLPMRYLHQPEKIFDGEKITQEEFNQAFSDAVTKLTAAYLSPLPILETA